MLYHCFELLSFLFNIDSFLEIKRACFTNEGIIDDCDLLMEEQMVFVKHPIQKFKSFEFSLMFDTFAN